MATHTNPGVTSTAFAPGIVTTAAPRWMAEADRKWSEARQRFLEAVAEDQRAAVALDLEAFGTRGVGLRTWLAAIAWRGGVLPDGLPRDLVQVYLDDPEARPLHECEACGLLIPIRPARRRGSIVVPSSLHFSNCPACGGRTGWYVFRAKASFTAGGDSQEGRRA